MAIETNELIDVQTLSPFKRFIMTIGNLPTSYLESMTYAELLMWFCNYLQNTVIPTVNNNAEAVEELQRLYEELKNYDIQEEVNKKLDEMAEDGTLDEIISKYMNDNLLITLNTVNDMLDTDLKKGQKVKTLGYYIINDGGSSLYSITDSEPSTYYETLNNGLYAELITNNIHNIKQYGVKGDGITDDTENIQKAINNLKYGEILQFNHNENYLISDTINLIGGANYDGFNCNFIPTNDFSAGQFIFEYGISSLTPSYNSGVIDYYIKNFSITNNNEININGFHINKDVTISNIYTWGLDRTIEVYDNYIDFVKINDVNVRGKRGSNYAIDTGFIGDSRELNRIHFHENSMISDTPNMLLVGAGHNNCIINSYINGNLNITGSNVIIKNSHIEIGNVTIANSETTIIGGYIYKTPEIKPFSITNSCVNFENVLISYRDDEDYTSDDSIDINFDTYSIIKLNNVFKIMQGTNVNFKHYAGIFTNNSEFNNSMLNNSIESLTRENVKNSYLVQSPSFAGNILGVMYTDNNNHWKQNNGTYYYRALLIFDKTRKVGWGSGSNELSANLTLNGNTPFIALNGRLKSDIRLYRGTTSGTYSHYVDTSTLDNRIIDNGIICNGNKWNVNESGTVDTYLFSYTYEKINQNNVRVYANSTPTYGTWTKGDIIIKSNPASGSPYGWVCIEAGTPGTWKAITQNIPS